MSDTQNGRMTVGNVMLAKVDQLSRQMTALEAKVAALNTSVTNASAASAANNNTASVDSVTIIRKLTEENAKLKKEISYVSAQIEGLFTTVSRMIKKLPEQVAEKLPEKMPEQQPVERVVEKVVAAEDQTFTIDLEDLANRVAAKIGPQQPVERVVEKVITTEGSNFSLDVDDLASRVAAKIIIPESGLDAEDASALAERLSMAATPATIGDVDYDQLGSAVAKRLYVPQAVAEEVDYNKLSEKLTEKLAIDYDQLGYSVAKRMYIPQAVAEEVDYNAIADKVIEKMPSMVTVTSETAYASAEPVSVQAELDYDLLASKVAEAVSVQEPVSADYIAARVAEQIVVPSSMQAESVDLDVEELSRKVADKIAIPSYEPADVTVDEEKLADAVAERLRVSDELAATTASYEANIDEQALAEDIASRLNFSLSDELIAAAVVKNLSDAIDSDEIADSVAKRVGTISPEQFEITVDDDGCDSLAKAVESKLDYDVIAAAVAEKLNPAFMATAAAEEIDSEELARAISEKLSVNADINEDVLADKAAAILSNYMPEIDSADIADKVVAGIIPALPGTPVIDSEGIASSVTEKIVESQEDSDYDIVIDEEGLTRITDEIAKDNDERYQKLDEKIEDVKEEYSGRFDKIDEDIAEIKRMLLAGIVVAANNTEEAVEEPEEEVVEEELVTVSDIVGEPEEEEVEEEVVEETVEEVVEEPEEEPEEEAKDEVIEEIVEDIDESPADGEVMPDGMDDEESGGVDFANMMKYNRSFIARIIQGTDDQKVYYGQVKTALLSYKKVNSNVAWGAERFNKGRETIARFKIRGKTLCLYLALDPTEFQTSVYHQVDVSDNKSMRGTPMMVKIKSPLGVKKAIRLIDEMLLRRNGEKHRVAERDYAAMYPYETIEELIEDGLVKDVNK